MDQLQKHGYFQGTRDTINFVQYMIEKKMTVAEIPLALKTLLGENEAWRQNATDAEPPSGYNIIDGAVK